MVAGSCMANNQRTEFLLAQIAPDNGVENALRLKTANGVTLDDLARCGLKSLDARHRKKRRRTRRRA